MEKWKSFAFHFNYAPLLIDIYTFIHINTHTIIHAYKHIYMLRPCQIVFELPFSLELSGCLAVIFLLPLSSLSRPLSLFLSLIRCIFLLVCIISCPSFLRFTKTTWVQEFYDFHECVGGLCWFVYDSCLFFFLPLFAHKDVCICVCVG